MLIFLTLLFGYGSSTVNGQRKVHYISESPCDDNPCLYGGSCHHVKDSVAYLCHCTGGHWGRHCEFAAGLQPCAHHQCQSGSTCKPDAGHADHYKCLCRSGQSGRYCNVTAMEVVGTMACEKKCGERGVAVISRKKKRPCTCDCHKSMYGKINSTDKLCLKSLPCAPKNRIDPSTGKGEQKLICENGGSCELSHLTDYYCKCQHFYTGKHCEKYDTRFGARNPCQPPPCGQGLCRLVKDQSAANPDVTPKAYCVCQPGYKGENCQKRITPCDLSAFEEECNAALKAKRIDPRCGKSNETAKKCHNGGVCEEYSFARKGFRCRCDVKPWIGEFCNFFEPCLVKDACQNGSSCVSTISEDGTSMKALCICQPDSQDVKCSQLDPNACDKFKKNPCYYGGICVKCHAQDSKGLHRHISPFCRTTDDFKRHFVCACPLGRSGAFCNETQWPCDKSRCRNGAMCINANMSDYECKCQNGYSGDYCETIDDICVARSPCYNGGRCIVQLVNKTSFFCLCKSGYHGIACQLEYYSFGYAYLNFHQYLAVLTLAIGIGTCVAFLIFNCLILEWIQSIKKALLADG